MSATASLGLSRLLSRPGQCTSTAAVENAAERSPLGLAADPAFDEKEASAEDGGALAATQSSIDSVKGKDSAGTCAPFIPLSSSSPPTMLLHRVPRGSTPGPSLVEARVHITLLMESLSYATVAHPSSSPNGSARTLTLDAPMTIPAGAAIVDRRSALSARGEIEEDRKTTRPHLQRDLWVEVESRFRLETRYKTRGNNIEFN